LIGGAPVETDATGLATFAGLSVDLVGSKQLSAASGVLTPAVSDSFAVTPAAAAALAFVQQPTAVAAGVPISPAVTVRVQDSYGNLVTSATDSVTLQLSPAPVPSSARRR